MSRAMSLIFSLAAIMAVAAPAGAQGRGKGQAKKTSIPPGHRPPAGMCRIWINGVPPGHQPAPTDCETALRNQPPNSQIIWGDNVRRRGRSDPARAHEPTGHVPGHTGGVDTPLDRAQFPSALPAMTGAVLFRVGVRTVDVQNWLGSGDLRSEPVDSNGDGVPEQATWYDGQGTVLQVWHDDDRDGRADSVDVYRNGQRVQVVR